ncbi:MAG: biotin--[acetyl-CoA-carboxylase] ligase [Bacteroidales bacterium]|nr:biotin--[acetyl-CoA-carboxylase] ligase [Bacteroidales bacterium]
MIASNHQKYDHFLVVDEVHSTNDLLRSLVDAKQVDFPMGYVVSAQYQTAGRGQIGNSWVSEKGKNLLFSILLYPQIEIKEQFLISKIVSLSVVSILKEWLPQEAANFSIKWPNDIYYNHKKIAGILIENLLLGDEIQNSIVGIGLNVEQIDFPSNLPNPVSLRQINDQLSYDKDLMIEQIRDKVVFLLQHSDELFFRNQLNTAYLSVLYKIHEYSFFSDKSGVFRAQITDVLPDGRLMLETEDGEHRFYYFKEVSFLPHCAEDENLSL